MRTVGLQHVWQGLLAHRQLLLGARLKEAGRRCAQVREIHGPANARQAGPAELQRVIGALPEAGPQPRSKEGCVLPVFASLPR